MKLKELTCYGPFSKTEQRVLDVVEKYSFSLPKERQTRTNPHNGRTHLLDPLAVLLYDFIVSPCIGRIVGQPTSKGGINRRDWNGARYIFLRRWSKEYDDLLD